jgi:hypothetical protein
MTETDPICAGEREAANDNGYAFGRPLVRGLRRRPGVRYAVSDNLILPLLFAEQHPSWWQTSAALRVRLRSAERAAQAAPPSMPVSSAEQALVQAGDSPRWTLDGTPTIRQGSPASET